MNSSNLILIKFLVRTLTIVSAFCLCACDSSSQDDIQYSFHSDSGQTYLDISLDKHILSRFSDDRLQHFLTESSSFGSDVRLACGTRSAVFHRECRYDRWNERYVIEDYYGGKDVRIFHSFEEFLAQMLVFGHIPMDSILPDGHSEQTVHSCRIRVEYSVSLMTFPPPINLLMFDRYKIRVRSVIVP